MHKDRRRTTVSKHGPLHHCYGRFKVYVLILLAFLLSQANVGSFKNIFLTFWLSWGGKKVDWDKRVETTGQVWEINKPVSM